MFLLVIVTFSLLRQLLHIIPSIDSYCHITNSVHSCIIMASSTPTLLVLLLSCLVCFFLLVTATNAPSALRQQVLYSSSEAENAANAPSSSSSSSAASLMSSRHTSLLTRLRNYSLTKPLATSTPRMHSMSTDENDSNPTQEQGMYPSRQRLTLRAFGKEFQVELVKNEKILAHDYSNLRFDYNGGAGAPAEGEVKLGSSSSHSSPLAEDRHCYYHGHVIGDPLSWVAIDTCHGVNGVIHAHEETFAITPDLLGEGEKLEAMAMGGSSAEADRSTSSSPLRHMHTLSTTPDEQNSKLAAHHVVYHLKDYEPVKTVCGVGKEQEEMHGKQQHKMKTEKLTAASASTLSNTSSSISAPQNHTTKQSYTNAPLIPGSPSPPDQRFVELLVVNDYERWKLHGENTEHETLAVVNLMDSYYRVTPFSVRYRIVLVGQVTFTNGDPYLIPFVSGNAPNVPPNVNQPKQADQPATPTPAMPETPVNPPVTPTNPSDPNTPDLSRIPPDLQYLIPEILKNLKNTENGADAGQQQPTTPGTTYNPYNSYTQPLVTNPSYNPQQQPIVAGRTTGQAVETQGLSGLLTVFNAWQYAESSLPRRDKVQLFSGLNFASGVLGLANVGMCCQQEYGSSVTEMNEPSLMQNAIIGAHEIGHTLGMSHDSMGNSCPSTGYIMASVAGVGTSFSTCSIASTNEWLSTNQPPPTCLADVPRVWMSEDSEIGTIPSQQQAHATTPQSNTTSATSSGAASTATSSSTIAPNTTPSIDAKPATHAGQTKFKLPAASTPPVSVATPPSVAEVDPKVSSPQGSESLQQTQFHTGQQDSHPKLSTSDWWLIGCGSFLGSLVAVFALVFLAKYLPRSISWHSALEVKQQQMRYLSAQQPLQSLQQAQQNEAQVHKKAPSFSSMFALNIGPSAPSTPTAAAVAGAHSAFMTSSAASSPTLKPHASPSPSFKTPLSPPPDTSTMQSEENASGNSSHHMHGTRAVRRPSLSNTHAHQQQQQQPHQSYTQQYNLSTHQAAAPRIPDTIPSESPEAY